MDKFWIGLCIVAILMIFIAIIGISDEWIKQTKRRRFEEWRRIAPPNWKSSRRRTGGDYW